MAGEEATFLDVLTGQHGEVGDGEGEGGKGGFRVWENCAFGDDGNGFIEIR